MSLFGAIDTSGTGVHAMQTWIDANAGNIANENDAVSPGTTPYQEQVAVFSPLAPGVADAASPGVAVAVDTAPSPGITVAGTAAGPAGQGGGSVVPDIALGDQLVGLVEAEEGYQADTSAMNHAIAAYRSGLQIGA